MEWQWTRAQSRAIALAVSILVGLSIGWWWLQQPTAEVKSAAPHQASTATSTPARAVVIVDVVGLVRSPGVVELPAGSRVLDAVRAAGGVRGSHEPGVNLARVLVDGEQIVVGEVAAPATGDGQININRADQSALEDLPGVGPVLAQRIIEYRTAHGGFRSVSELDGVSGVGPAMMAKLKDHISVG